MMTAPSSVEKVESVRKNALNIRVLIHIMILEKEE